jgi:ribose/xylose/arabinose/galactoside ABC-type transport system permease subunit
VPYANQDFAFAFDGQILGVLSPRILTVLAVFAVAALVLHGTRVGAHLRAVGGDRHASRAAGVRVDAITIGVFTASGGLCALAGGMAAYGVASATPEVGYAPLVFGVIAIIVGGVSLAGGTGTVLGMACGGLALATLNQTLAIVGAPGYVAGAVTGGLLAAMAVLSSPDLLRRASARRIRRDALRAGAVAA